MSDSESKLILVTGGSGYVAAHIVEQLLNAGYRVRTTARGAKVAQLQELLTAQFGDKAEVVDVPDITHGTFPLDGVDAVIHTASPLIGGDVTPQQLLVSAIEGSMNVLRQTHAAGIRRFIYTGSLVSAFTPSLTMTDKDWYTVPPNASLDDPVVAYCYGKTEAEKAIWAYGEKHPELDITVFNPAYIYGPLASTFMLPKDPSQSRLSTATHLFCLLYPDAKFSRLLGYADVRDVAKAHVLALHHHHNPTPDRKKRFPFTSPHPLVTWDNVIALIAKERPELKPRLTTSTSPVYTKANTIPPTDYRRLEEVLGLKVEDYHTLESTVLDTIDSLVKLEKYWLANGHALPATSPR